LPSGGEYQTGSCEFSTTKVIKTEDGGRALPLGMTFLTAFSAGIELYEEVFWCTPREFKLVEPRVPFHYTRRTYYSLQKTHVVEKADKIKVRLSNGRNMTQKL